MEYAFLEMLGIKICTYLPLVKVSYHLLALPEV